MKQEWKERLFKAIIEAVIAFITAFTVASCTVAAVAEKETDNAENLKDAHTAAPDCQHWDCALIDFAHDDNCD